MHKPRVGVDIDLVQCFRLLMLEARVGFGIGFDRLVQFACGLDNIRKSLFVCERGRERARARASFWCMTELCVTTSINLKPHGSINPATHTAYTLSPMQEMWFSSRALPGRQRFSL
jgi:hypothetical protein